MSHIVDSWCWPVNWARDSWVSTGSPRKVSIKAKVKANEFDFLVVLRAHAYFESHLLKIRSRIVFIALQAIIERSVGFIEGFVCGPRLEAWPKTLRSSVQGIVLPNRYAIVGKPYPFEALCHQMFWHYTLQTAPAYSDVNKRQIFSRGLYELNSNFVHRFFIG